MHHYPTIKPGSTIHLFNVLQSLPQTHYNQKGKNNAKVCTSQRLCRSKIYRNPYLYETAPCARYDGCGFCHSGYSL